MKKLFLMVSLLFITSASFAMTPRVFYTDIESGPKTGGENNKGAWVTICGVGFGSAGANSYVTIGGGRCDNYPIWTDTKIVAQLGSLVATGNIVVVNTEGSGTYSIPFTVRSGNIYFVNVNASGGNGTVGSPWGNPASFFSVRAAGDICYFRSGNYPSTYIGGYYNFDLRTYGGDGTASNPIVLCGYPGENPIIICPNNQKGCIDFRNRYYYTFANFTIKGYGYPSDRLINNGGGGGNRVVNCSVGYVTAVVWAVFSANENNFKVWGCEFTQVNTDNHMTHIFYNDSGSGNVVDCGWCYYHDNNIVDGAFYKDSSGQACHMFVHDSILDSSAMSNGSLGGLCWAQLAGGSSIIYWYNNIFIGKTAGNKAASFTTDATGQGMMYIYNNTFYNWAAKPTSSFTPRPLVGNNFVFYNNMVVSMPSDLTICASGVSHDYNCYYNVPNTPSESHSVTSNPLLNNPSSWDMSLQSGSPALSAGTNTYQLTLDKFGSVRPNPTSIGAFELTPGASIPNTVTISGHVVDENNSGIVTVTITCSNGLSYQTYTDANGNYTIPNVTKGTTFTITPTKADWTFTPTSLTETNVQADITSQDFVGDGIPPTLYGVTGTITNSVAAPVPDVSVNLILNGSNAGNVITAVNGTYSFANIPTGSTCTVTPSYGYWTFSPTSRTYNNITSTQTGVNFTGTSGSGVCTISGYIVDTSSNYITGSQINMTGSYTMSQIPGAGGSFTFNNVPINSNIILTPSAANYTFTPISVSSAILTSNWSVGKFFGTAAVAVSTATPVIYYSDIESGANTGGRGNNGAIITITGRNFGTTQLTSYVSIGSTVAASIISWTDTRIAFQPGALCATGNIHVNKIDGEISNGIPFTIRSGNIYFVCISSPANGANGTYEHPWPDLHIFYSSAAAGDSCYIRTGVYSGKYMDNTSGSLSNFLPLAAGPSGSVGNEISWIGYPGETVTFYAPAGGDNIDIEYVPKDGYQFCNLVFISTAVSTMLSGNHTSFINNTVTALNRGTDIGATIRCATGSNFRIIGNTMTNCPYTSTMTRGYDLRLLDITNSTIAWNNSLITNNNGVGPCVYAGGDCSNVQVFCNNFNGGGATNTRALIWNGNASMDMNFYNNVFQNVATDNSNWGAFNFWGGNSKFYNNTIFNIHGVSATGAGIFRVGGQFVETIDLQNNILYSNGAMGALYRSDTVGTVITDYNDYWGCLNYPTDLHSIVVNPMFIANGTDYHLQSNSPVIGEGCVLHIVSKDKDNNTRSSTPTIGAYEYIVSYTPPSPYILPAASVRVRCTFLE